jgi:hypothetical protein
MGISHHISHVCLDTSAAGRQSNDHIDNRATEKETSRRRDEVAGKFQSLERHPPDCRGTLR